MRQVILNEKSTNVENKSQSMDESLFMEKDESNLKDSTTEEVRK